MVRLVAEFRHLIIKKNKKYTSVYGKWKLTTESGVARFNINRISSNKKS